jgi:hypothetical protein
MPEHAIAGHRASNGVRHATNALVSLLRLFVIVGASTLLTSVAGVAVYAAPITIPLLAIVAATSRGRGWRVAATAVVALTFLEVVWMLTWLLWPSLGGSFVLALGAAVALTYAFWKMTRPAQPAHA